MRLAEVTMKQSTETVKLKCGACGKGFMTVPPIDMCPFCYARQVDVTVDKRPKESTNGEA